MEVTIHRERLSASVVVGLLLTALGCSSTTPVGLFTDIADVSTITGLKIVPPSLVKSRGRRSVQPGAMLNPETGVWAGDLQLSPDLLSSSGTFLESRASLKLNTKELCQFVWSIGCCGDYDCAGVRGEDIETVVVLEYARREYASRKTIELLGTERVDTKTMVIGEVVYASTLLIPYELGVCTHRDEEYQPELVERSEGIFVKCELPPAYPVLIRTWTVDARDSNE